MDDLRALCAKSTVFLRREALALGYDDRTLHHARKKGALHRVRHGAYLFDDNWAALDRRERHLVEGAAVLRTAKAGAVLSQISAVAAHGLPLWAVPLEEVHLTRIDRFAGRSEARVRQHRGVLDTEAVATAHDLPVTSPARTALDLTALTDVEHAVPVLSEMLRKGLTTKAQLHTMYDSMRQVPGTLTSPLAIGLAHERLESVGEARCWCMFFR